jgi:Helix-turn-helix domain
VSSRFARLVNASTTPAKTDSPSAKDSPTKQDALSTLDSLSTDAGQSTADSPVSQSGPSPDIPPPPPAAGPSETDSPAKKTSPSTEDSQLLSIIPQVKGHTEMPHAYTDHLARWLSADEQAVYVQLYRLSWGWGKDTCFISNPKLSERSGVPETSMRRAVKKLISKRLVEKTDRVFGSKTEQGIEYRVFSLNRLTKLDGRAERDRQSKAAPNKDQIKETDQRADASRCPDCMGTNFYYPAGKEKGVARCEHKRLR